MDNNTCDIKIEYLIPHLSMGETNEEESADQFPSTTDDSNCLSVQNEEEPAAKKSRLEKEWSNTTVLEFLDCFRKEPVIWKATHPRHNNRKDVYHAWKRIEIAMNKQFTVNELRKKRDSLMASFRTCLAKVRSSQKNDAATDDVYKPTWFAYKKMYAFLADKRKPRATKKEKILSQLSDENIADSPDCIEPLESNLVNSIACRGENNEWTNELVLQFLECFRKESVLWNCAHPQYKNRSELYSAWDRIEVAMNKQFTVNELKKKRDSLMASFRTCLAKVRSSLRSSTDDVYKPVWFAYDKMSLFLMDKDEAKAPKISEVTLSQLSDDFIDENSHDSPEYGDPIETILENEIECRNENMGPVSSSNTENGTTPKQIFAEKSETDALNKKMDSVYSILQSTIHNPTKEKTLFDIYGELVAAKLKAMDGQRSEIAMNRIDNLLFEIKMSNNVLLLPSTSADSQVFSISCNANGAGVPSVPTPTTSQPYVIIQPTVSGSQDGKEIRTSREYT